MIPDHFRGEDGQHLLNIIVHWIKVLIQCNQLALHTTRLLVQRIFINVGTLPYYRFFRQNTVSPIKRIAQRVTEGASGEEITRLLSNWRERKLYELHFIQLASTILAGGVIGCFSWAAVTDGYWIGPAFWYSSLVLSVLAILLSSSQSFIFTSLNEPNQEQNSIGDYRRHLALITIVSDHPSSVVGEIPSLRGQRLCVPRWKMVFVWQSPMMLMAYAVCFFLLGLIIYICTPLFRGEFSSNGAKTAYLFLVVFALSGGVFVYSSFWAYKFIDLDGAIHVD